METIVRIGLDTSKSVFQLHGVDGTEQPVLRQRLRRGQVLEFFKLCRLRLCSGGLWGIALLGAGAAIAGA